MSHPDLSYCVGLEAPDLPSATDTAQKLPPRVSGSTSLRVETGEGKVVGVTGGGEWGGPSPEVLPRSWP